MMALDWQVFPWQMFSVSRLSFLKGRQAVSALARGGAMAWLGALLLAGLGFAPAGATETVLHSFTQHYNAGANPVGQLLLVGKLFYGVTQFGVNGNGSVFTMTPSGLIHTIHEFAGGTADGALPNAGLVLAHGN